MTTGRRATLSEVLSEFPGHKRRASSMWRGRGNPRRSITAGVLLCEDVSNRSQTCSVSDRPFGDSRRLMSRARGLATISERRSFEQ
jgi:hypothetical protein